MLKKTFKNELKSLLHRNIMVFVILFILPLFVTFMLGIELKDETLTNIPIAVIDRDNSKLSRDLIESFDNNEIFSVTQYLNTEMELEQMMKNSKVRLGLVIPEGFYADIATLKSPSVLMVYDGSHMSLTGTAKSKATEILLTYKAAISMKQISARLGISEENALDIVDMFSFQHVTLYNENKSYENFLAPIFLAGCIQSALALSVALGIDHNIFMLDRIKRKGYFTSKVLAYSVMGIASFFICMFFQVFLFGLPFEGSILDALILIASLCIAVSSFGLIISLLFPSKQIAVVACGIAFIPNSIMAGSTWPLISMPVGYRAFAEYVPFAHFVNQFRDVYLKGITMQDFSSDVIYMIGFGVAFTLLGELVIYITEKKENGNEMNEVFDAYRRIFPSIFKNRGLLILVFIGPMFLTLFIGGVYVNDSVNDIKIAVIDADNTQTSRMIVDYFATNERFVVSNYPNTKDELLALIESGQVSAGILIPKDLEKNVRRSQSINVLFITDGTNLVMANNAYAQAASIIKTVSAGVEIKLLEAKGLTPYTSTQIAKIINIGDRMLYDPLMTYMSYLIICFVAVFFQQLFLSGMGSMLTQEHHYLSAENVRIKSLAVAASIITTFLPSFLLCFVTVRYAFHVPIQGNIFFSLVFAILFLFSLTGPSLILAALTKNRERYTQFSFMLSLPTFVASGCVWPVSQMPELFVFFTRLSWPLISFAKPLQEILVKGREIHTVIPSILHIALYGCIYLVIGAWLYKRAYNNHDKLCLKTDILKQSITLK